MPKTIESVRPDGLQVIRHELEPMEAVALRTMYPLDGDKSSVFKRFGHRNNVVLGTLSIGGLDLSILQDLGDPADTSQGRVELPADRRPIKLVDQQYNYFDNSAPLHRMTVFDELTVGLDTIPRGMSRQVIHDGTSELSGVHAKVVDASKLGWLIVENLNPLNSTVLRYAEPVVTPRA